MGSETRTHTHTRRARETRLDRSCEATSPKTALAITAFRHAGDRASRAAAPLSTPAPPEACVVRRAAVQRGALRRGRRRQRARLDDEQSPPARDFVFLPCSIVGGVRRPARALPAHGGAHRPAVLCPGARRAAGRRLPCGGAAAAAAARQGRAGPQSGQRQTYVGVYATMGNPSAQAPTQSYVSRRQTRRTRHCRAPGGPGCACRSAGGARRRAGTPRAAAGVRERRPARKTRATRPASATRDVGYRPPRRNARHPLHRRRCCAPKPADQTACAPCRQPCGNHGRPRRALPPGSGCADFRPVFVSSVPEGGVTNRYSLPQACTAAFSHACAATAAGLRAPLHGGLGAAAGAAQGRQRCGGGRRRRPKEGGAGRKRIAVCHGRGSFIRRSVSSSCVSPAAASLRGLCPDAAPAGGAWEQRARTQRGPARATRRRAPRANCSGEGDRTTGCRGVITIIHRPRTSLGRGRAAAGLRVPRPWPPLPVAARRRCVQRRGEGVERLTGETVGPVPPVVESLWRAPRWRVVPCGRRHPRLASPPCALARLSTLGATWRLPCCSRPRPLCTSHRHEAERAAAACKITLDVQKTFQAAHTRSPPAPARACAMLPSPALLPSRHAALPSPGRCWALLCSPRATATRRHRACVISPPLGVPTTPRTVVLTFIFIFFCWRLRRRGARSRWTGPVAGVGAAHACLSVSGGGGGGLCDTWQWPDRRFGSVFFVYYYFGYVLNHDVCDGMATY